MKKVRLIKIGGTFEDVNLKDVEYIDMVNKTVETKTEIIHGVISIWIDN